MEWWENDGYEAVDEDLASLGNRAKTVYDNNRKTVRNVGIGAAALGAGAALKYGVSKFRANRAKKAAAAQQAAQQQNQNAQGQPAECGTNCEGFSWIEDPGAQHIMEGYFSEFADADMYDAPEPHPNSDNEWDA